MTQTNVSTQCKHLDSIIDKGYTTCMECGLVLEDNHIINQTPRVYNKIDILKKVHTECSSNPFIKRTGFTVNNKIINKPKFKQLQKIDVQNTNIHVKTKKAKLLFSQFLIDKGLKNNNIIKYFNFYLKKTITINLQGKYLKDYVATLIIFILRKLQIPIGIKDILKYFNTKYESVRRLMEELRDVYSLDFSTKISVKFFINFYANKLNNISNEDKILLIKEGIQLSEKLEKDNNFYSGKNILSIVGGILYYIAQIFEIEINQIELAKLLNTNSTSVRAYYKFINENLNYYPKKLNYKYKHSDEHKRKIGNANRGKVRSEEFKQNISEARKRFWEQKKINKNKLCIKNII